MLSISGQEYMARFVSFASCVFCLSRAADVSFHADRSYSLQSMETGYFVNVGSSPPEADPFQHVLPQTYKFISQGIAGSPYGTYAIRSDATGKYINVDTRHANSSRIWQADTAQLFHVIPQGSVAGEPIVSLQSKETALYLNANIDQPWNGGEVHMQNYGQRFILGEGVPTSPFYTAKFDDKQKKVFYWSHAPNGAGSDSWASVTLTAKSVNVTIQAKSSKSSHVTIRPKHFVDWGWVTNVLAQDGQVTFSVMKPCQLSVEIGLERDIMGTQSSYDAFDTMLVFINPPESTWSGAEGRVVKPTRATCSGTCVLGSSLLKDGCKASHVNGDVYFDDSHPFYIWSIDGCRLENGLAMKRLDVEGNVFIDDGVVVFARITSSKAGSGVYGYGMVSNFYQLGQKSPGGKHWSNNIDLDGQNSTLWGIISIASTYRNLHVGRYSEVHFTKSIASPYITETDCLNTEGDALVTNNFFKSNDDCIKVYKSYTVYKNNVMWHQYVGGGIMISWGNQNENTDNVTDVLVENTYIIHDAVSYSVQCTENFSQILKSMHYYSFLIRMFHANGNLVGFPNVTTIKNLYLESRVGSVLGLFNGLKGDGWAEWMDGEGPSGDVSLGINGLDMTYVTFVAAPVLIGGCRPGDTINAAHCMCSGELLPPYTCSIHLKIDNSTSTSLLRLSTARKLVMGNQVNLHVLNGTQFELFPARGTWQATAPANLADSFQALCPMQALTSIVAVVSILCFLGTGALVFALRCARNPPAPSMQPLIRPEVGSK